MMIGRSDVDKTARRRQRNAARYDRLSRWHTAFAWMPVRVPDGRIVWLGSVDRRGVFGTGVEHRSAFGSIIEWTPVPAGAELLAIDDIERIGWQYRLQSAP